MVEDDNESSTEQEPEQNAPTIGRVEWLDLTVDDASGIRNFYKSVIGWTSSDVPMGSYEDFNMNIPGTKETVAGVCHARGANASLPRQWLVYVRVKNVAESAAQCKKLGGKVLNGPQRMGGSDFCVIQDPAGAIIALVSK